LKLPLYSNRSVGDGTQNIIGNLSRHDLASMIAAGAAHMETVTMHDEKTGRTWKEEIVIADDPRRAAYNYELDR
jgi:hypothetical protein